MPNHTTDPTAPDTPAASGLRAAIARRAKPSLSRLTGAEIASAMTDEQKAEMAAKLGVTGKAPAMAKGRSWSAAIGASAAAKAVTSRAIAVMNSRHFERHRELAIKLFRNPKLSGREISAMLDLA